MNEITLKLLPTNVASWLGMSGAVPAPTAAPAAPAPAPQTANGPTHPVESPSAGSRVAALLRLARKAKPTPPNTALSDFPFDTAELALCAGLRGLTAELKTDQQDKKKWSKAERNATGLPCLAAYPRTVKVVKFVDKVKVEIQKLLHANTVTMPAPNTGRTARSYIAGQSPPNDWKKCEAFLTQACESGQGVFQFVSVQQQADRNRACHTLPIVEQLARQRILWQEQNHEYLTGQPIPEKPLIIGGRYRVVSYLDHDDHHSKAPDGNPNFDQRWYTLYFTDVNDRLNRQQSVPITQVGIPFKNRLLDVAGIHRASELFKEHCGRIASPADNTSPDEMHMFVSTAGFGRNATLMTFHEMEQQIIAGEITNAAQLDEKLHDAIIAGRTQRGYRFIHSEEQVAMLRRALVVLLPKPLVRRPLTNNGIVQPPPTREQAGTDLMHALQHAAATKMKEYAVLDAKTDRNSIEDESHRQLQYDIGENLRLQHVLQKFLKDQPPRISTDQSSVVTALDECLARQLAEAEALRNDPAAQPVAGDGAGAAVDDPAAQRASNDTGAPAHDAARPNFDEQQESDNKREWLKKFELESVINESSDNKDDVNAGNNSFIVSLLKHATGVYRDPSHRDMAKILHEDLVTRVHSELEAQNPGKVPDILELHTDQRARNLLVQTINALYGCNLKPHWLLLERVNDVLVEKLSKYVGDDNMDVDADAEDKCDRVLIYQSSNRYEAVVPKTAVPRPLDTILAIMERKTERMLADIAKNDGPCDDLIKQLGDQKGAVEMRIEDEKNKLGEAVVYLPIEGFANTHYPHHKHFENIGNNHYVAKCNRQAAPFKQQFNDKIDALLGQLEGRVTPQEHADITKLKFQIPS